MKAKQFWFKTFTGQSIFEVMEDYAQHRESEELAKLRKETEEVKLELEYWKKRAIEEGANDEYLG